MTHSTHDLRPIDILLKNSCQITVQIDKRETYKGDMIEQTSDTLQYWTIDKWYFRVIH